MTVRHPARPKARVSVRRSLARSCWYRRALSTHTPDCRVEWASQLTPPNVGDVSQPLSDEKPAARSPRVPESSTASTPGEKLEPSTATRP